MASSSDTPTRDGEKDLRLPAAPVDVIVEPIARFLHVQSASGAALLLATVAALFLANSPWAPGFLAFWETPIGFLAGGLEIRYSLKHWINDGLMAIFFFVIGLEVKREIVLGELRDLRTAALPIAAALGGMVVPAAIYLALQWGEPGQHGWGIPMATDIAFVVGCMAILGSRVPPSLRVLLLSLAIADDIGAILVIAVGYSGALNFTALAWAAGGIALLVLMRKSGIRRFAPYVLAGALVWFAVHESGIHPTIAGVVLGLMTPSRPLVSNSLLVRFVHEVGDYLHGELPDTNRDLMLERSSRLGKLAEATRETISPLERLETALHPWVGFIIMPLFALANAGVAIEPGALRDAVAVAVVAGLAIGKPVGIVLFSFAAVRIGLARLPESISWMTLTAGGVLAGIGFTMSLFIAELALEGEPLDAAKIGIIGGSTLCAAAGMLLLVVFARRSPAT